MNVAVDYLSSAATERPLRGGTERLTSRSILQEEDTTRA